MRFSDFFLICGDETWWWLVNYQAHSRYVYIYPGWMQLKLVTKWWKSTSKACCGINLPVMQLRHCSMSATVDSLLVLLLHGAISPCSCSLYRNLCRVIGYHHFSTWTHFFRYERSYEYFLPFFIRECMYILKTLPNKFNKTEWVGLDVCYYVL